MIARRERYAWLFTVPAAVVYLPLLAIPLFYSLTLSLYRWNGLAPAWTWVGLANYGRALGDGVFWRALGNNAILVVVSLAVQLPVALFLAVLLHRAGRWLGIARTGLFLPYILPTVVIALVWKLLLNAAAPLWLASPRWSIWALVLAISWRFIGFHMVLYLAGMSTIDPELYEAARLDGAGEWACFRHITLPLLRPVLVVSATLSVVGAVKYFDIVWVMTGGGPSHATELLATYMFKAAFDSSYWGYGSALAVTLAGLALAAMAGALLVGRRTREAA